MIRFLSVFLMYAATFVVGIVSSQQRVSGAQIPIAVPEFTIQDAATFLAVFVLMTFFLLRFGRAARVSISVLLTLAILAGSMFVFGAWLPWPLDLVAAILLVLFVRARPFVLPHDLGVICAIAGVSGMLGLALTPLWAVGLLAILSLYDIYAVYRSQHMVALAGRMLEVGAVFGFLVPGNLHTFVRPVRKALADRSVMILGSGDVGLPLMLAVASIPTSIAAAWVVAFSSLVGLGVMQWLFLHQERPRPMAALPPIALFAILGYVLSLSLGI